MGYLASVRATEPEGYEVICSRCGDDGGPVHEQPEHVQWLRGPYSTSHEARAVANRHNVGHLTEPL